MAASFPTSLDNIETANPTAELHFPALFTRVLQICDALEVKVGIDGSAVTTSHDYLIANRQPLDADLTSIAALTTTSFGRSLLTQADAAATRTTIGAGTGSGDALTTNPLSQFAATTSAQLRGVLSDESGTGAAYFQGGDLGTPSAGVLTSCTGTASGLTAGAATVLATARTINGTSFNGSANITITAAGSTLSDTVTIAKGGTGETTAAAARVALLPSMTGNSLKTLRVNVGETDYELSTSGAGDVVGPASATDNAIVRFDSTTGKLIQNSGVTIDDSSTMTAATINFSGGFISGTLGITIANVTQGNFASTGLRVLDTNDSHYMIIVCGSDLTANRQLTFTMGDAARTVTLSADLTVPATASVSGTLVAASGKTFTSSNTITLTATDGSTLAIGGGGTLGTAAYTAASAYQPIDATLTAFAALTIAADSLTIGSGADAFSQVTFAANKFPAKSSTGGLVAKDITDFALTILDDADAAAVRTTIGAGTGSGDALTTNPLSQFASTTSAQLRGVLSDETGTGAAYFQGGDMGTPSAGVLTNCTGQTWEKLSTATASSSATIDFTGLTTDAAYCVVYTHVAPATDAVEFHCLTSTNGGSTYDSTIGTYRWAAIAGTDAAGSSFEGSSSDTKLRVGSNLGNAANETCSGSFTLYNPSAAKYGTATWHNMVVNSSGVLVTRAGSGQRLSAADIDAIRFVMSSGNIASGIFTLYRLKA